MLNFRSLSTMVGVTLLFVAAMMVIPLGVSYYYRDGDSNGILAAMACAGGVGVGLALFGRGERDLGLREGFAVVTLGWLAMAFAGALPFVFTGSIPSFVDAFFESASGFTTTGASILGGGIKIESLPHGVLFWRSLTHWIGGMGIILLSLAILPLLGVGGMQLYRAEVSGPTKDKLTPRIQDTANILWMYYLFFTVLEIVFLLLGGMDLFDASCHTFGTLATGGFSTYTDSVGAFNSAYIEYVIIVFMLIGGTSFALHAGLLKMQFSRYWASREFRLFLSVVAFFTAALMASNLLGGGGEEVGKAFRESLFAVVSIITSTGFVSPDWEKWGSFAQVAMVLLMLSGGMAGSTSGGTKIVRMQILLRQLGIELRRLVHPQALFRLWIGDRIIDEGIVQKVLVFLLAVGLLLILSTLLLTAIGLDLVTSFSASLTCFSNVGPGLGDVGPTDNYSWIPHPAKWILVAVMILGRLEVFTVLVLFSRHFWRR